MNMNNTQTSTPTPITTNSDPQYILTYTPKNIYQVYQFCNQYDDKDLIYRYDQLTNSFSVRGISWAYVYELSELGPTKVTRDQWNRFFATIRLLSATVIAAIPDDKRNEFECWYMKILRHSNRPTYTIRLLRQRGIVLIEEDSAINISNGSNLLIPFNQTLKDRILKYQQELKGAVTDILGIKLTTT